MARTNVPTRYSRILLPTPNQPSVPHRPGAARGGQGGGAPQYMFTPIEDATLLTALFANVANLGLDPDFTFFAIKEFERQLDTVGVHMSELRPDNVLVVEPTAAVSLVDFVSKLMLERKYVDQTVLHQSAHVVYDAWLLAAIDPAVTLADLDFEPFYTNDVQAIEATEHLDLGRIWLQLDAGEHLPILYYNRSVVTAYLRNLRVERPHYYEMVEYLRPDAIPAESTVLATGGLYDLRTPDGAIDLVKVTDTPLHGRCPYCTRPFTEPSLWALILDVVGSPLAAFAEKKGARYYQFDVMHAACAMHLAYHSFVHNIPLKVGFAPVISLREQLDLTKLPDANIAALLKHDADRSLFIQALNSARERGRVNWANRALIRLYLQSDADPDSRWDRLPEPNSSIFIIPRLTADLRVFFQIGGNPRLLDDLSFPDRISVLHIAIALDAWYEFMYIYQGPTREFISAHTLLSLARAYQATKIRKHLQDVSAASTLAREDVSLTREDASLTRENVSRTALPSVISETRPVLPPGLSIEVSFLFESDIAGGKVHQYASEINPVLHVFVSHDLGVIDPAASDEGVVVVSTSELRAQQTDKSITIRLPIRLESIDLAAHDHRGDQLIVGGRAHRAVRRNGVVLLPADVIVGFNLYVETSAESGQVCRTTAGSASVLLSELLAHPSEDTSICWQNTGSTPLAKGFLQIVDAQVLHTTARGTRPIKYGDCFQFAGDAEFPAIFLDGDKPSVAQAAKNTREFMAKRRERSLDIFLGDGAALATPKPDIMKRMHCPDYKIPRALLPGGIYVHRLPRAVPSAPIYLNLLRMTLLRDDVDAGMLLRAIAAQGTSNRLIPGMRYMFKIMMQMFGVIANTYVYLSDFVNDGGDTYTSTHDGLVRVRLIHKKRVNRFEAVQITEDYAEDSQNDAADCEGVAHEILKDAIMLRYVDLSELPLSPESDLLRAFQGYGRDNVYSPNLTLAAVTNKKLDTVAGDFAADAAQAHTFTPFLPTGKLLAHLDAAGTQRVEVEALRRSHFARNYKAQPWHAELEPIIIEGTARATGFQRPVTEYYPAGPRREMAVAREQARRAALYAILRELPAGLVATEIPSKAITDPGNKIANNQVDASNFYKYMSAAYVKGAAQSGIFDVAYAMRDGDQLTHSVSFNDFSRPEWPDALRLVPYNQLDAAIGAKIDAALQQLEPIPGRRRSATAAAAAEERGCPLLSPLADDFPVHEYVPRTEDPTQMPLPPRTIVLSVRDQDLTADGAAKIIAAIRTAKAHFTSFRIVTHYVIDAPVHGDETSLPPIIIHDLVLGITK